MSECQGCHKPLFRCRSCGNVGCKTKPGKCPQSGFHPWVDMCLKCGKFDSELVAAGDEIHP